MTDWKTEVKADVDLDKNQQLTRHLLSIELTCSDLAFVREIYEDGEERFHVVVGVDDFMFEDRRDLIRFLNKAMCVMLEGNYDTWKERVKKK